MGSECDFPQTEKYSDSLKVWFLRAALYFLSRAQLGNMPDMLWSLKILILGKAACVLVLYLLIRMVKEWKITPLFRSEGVFPSSFAIFVLLSPP